LTSFNERRRILLFVSFFFLNNKIDIKNNKVLIKYLLTKIEREREDDKISQSAHSFNNNKFIYFHDDIDGLLKKTLFVFIPLFRNN
jgi:hypothetical protein